MAKLGDPFDFAIGCLNRVLLISTGVLQKYFTVLLYKHTFIGFIVITISSVFERDIHVMSYLHMYFYQPMHAQNLFLIHNFYKPVSKF